MLSLTVVQGLLPRVPAWWVFVHSRKRYFIWTMAFGTHSAAFWVALGVGYFSEVCEHADCTRPAVKGQNSSVHLEVGPGSSVLCIMSLFKCITKELMMTSAGTTKDPLVWETCLFALNDMVRNVDFFQDIRSSC